MKINRASSIFLCGLAAFVSNFALADVDPGAQSQINSKSLYERIGEKAILNYWGLYRGASIGDPGNALTPSSSGGLDNSTPQGVENMITAAYKFNPDTSLGVLTHFYYYPGLKPDGSSATFQFYDPIIQFERKNIINSNGLKLTGRFWIDVPLSKFDRPYQANNLTALSAIGILSYDVPKTPLTLGLFGYLRGYIPTASTPDDARTYKIYVAPNANYQISSKVSATLWVDLVQVTRNGNAPGIIGGMSNDTMDIQPGIKWDITKNISLNPFLNIYPGNLTLAATSLQAVLTAKAF